MNFWHPAFRSLVGVTFSRMVHLSSAVEQVADNVVTASNETAAIRYEFGEAGMTWQLTNKSDSSLVFFMVFI